MLELLALRRAIRRLRRHAAAVGRPLDDFTDAEVLAGTVALARSAGDFGVTTAAAEAGARRLGAALDFTVSRN